ncbi:MAG: hypothetical protein MJY89_04885 [Bacteroidales bacterium]|nr:hypothetical protein [Bacteroidales bacterium]
MKTKRLTIFFLLGLTVAACAPNEVGGPTAISLVRNILSDKNSPEYRMLASHSEGNPASDICIIGSEKECIALAEAMAAQDRRDNISGSVQSDGLRDFSGENISCIIDTMAVKYGGILIARKEYIVRERAVRIAMNAIDTVCHLSPYDIDGMGTKQSSKVMIIANPHMSKYGKFDIDTLFRGTGCGCAVITPLEVMMDEALSEQRSVSIAILAKPQFSYSEAYMDCFDSKVRKAAGAEGSKCVVLAAHSDSSSIMKSFLDDYIAEGHKEALDVIMVDDIGLDINELKSELASLISIMNEESMVYGKLISNDFKVLDAASSTCRWTYNHLREKNLFTHNIYKPQINTYIPVEAQDGSNSLLLIPGNHYVQN